jgi:hypothetical protein
MALISELNANGLEGSVWFGGFSIVWRVVDSGRVLGACSNMGCYMEDYRSRLGTWAARTVWRGKAETLSDK